jgi:hypothetical protein
MPIAIDPNSTPREKVQEVLRYVHEREAVQNRILAELSHLRQQTAWLIAFCQRIAGAIPQAGLHIPQPPKPPSPTAQAIRTVFERNSKTVSAAIEGLLRGLFPGK